MFSFVHQLYSGLLYFLLLGSTVAILAQTGIADDALTKAEKGFSLKDCCTKATTNASILSVSTVAAVTPTTIYMI